ncbi:zinc finger BED domain-containing 4-like [Brachionus plicatilis]|uniref:Zinc finger BED domain-containing 4-like n=1 Tax=Brachionus plicatilis TaxID=10195 RepID=A0A3M7PTC6_BRAPC|nr:zinc finger BED domain-containing 4-like [Brachionus plicatilis]
MDNDNKNQTIINEIIKRCKHLVGSIKHSEALEKTLKSILNYYPISLYEMGEYITMSIIVNKEALNTMKYDPACQCIASYVPSENEFETINELCLLLEPLKELTTAITYLDPSYKNFEFVNGVSQRRQMIEVAKIYLKDLYQSKIQIEKTNSQQLISESQASPLTPLDQNRDYIVTKNSTSSSSSSPRNNNLSENLQSTPVYKDKF